MKITILQTGSTLVSSAVPDRGSHRWRYAYTDLFQRRRNRIQVPVKAFLVETMGHRILVDTGWSAECVSHPIRHLGVPLWFASEPVISEGESVPEQLHNMGMEPRDLDAVILTHLDCDHASGVNPFREAQHIYCSGEEWRHACTVRDVRYRRSLWDEVRMETLTMREDATAPFGRSCDLFGDGSVRVVLTPGHTAGSVVILAKGDGGYAAFVGDDSYNRHSWEDLRLPGPVFNIPDMNRTLHWIQTLSRDPECIAIYAAHDPEGPEGGSDL